MFALVAVLTPVCMYFGVRGFAPTLALAGLFCLPLARPSGKAWVGAGILAALVAWAAISTAWSPARTWHTIGNLKDFQRLTAMHLVLQLLLSGAFVFSAGRMTAATAERSVTWLGCGLLAGAAILTVEMATQGSFYMALAKVAGQPVRPDLAIRNLAQAGDVAAMLAWPVGLAFVWRGWRRAALALAAFVPLSFLLFRGFAPSAALLISLPVFFWVRAAGRPALLALLGLAAAYVLLTPWAMLAFQQLDAVANIQERLPPSWAARLEIWTLVTDRMLDHPLRGAGLDASRLLPGGILHPHDGPLQLWFELGVPGAVLGAAYWGWLFWRLAARAERETLFAATAAATATVYLVIGAVGFGLWQEWWICVGALGLAACIAVGKFIDGDQPAWRTATD